VTKKGSTPRSPSRRSPQETAFEREFPGGSQSANASVIALVRTYDAVITMTNKATSHHGLSGAGRQALAILEGAERPLSPPVLAERMFITTASTTSLLDTLERRGLVVRLSDATDRRRIRVDLTDAGRKLVDDFLPQVVALQTAAMARLSEAEREQLLNSLAVIRATVAELDGGEVTSAAPKRGKSRRG
jgi:DNA-binding MarR family transcriptional regulator